MVLPAAGPFGPFLLVVLVLGLPVQFAIGSLVALGRRVPATATVLAPILALALGGMGAVAGVNGAIAAIATASDPTWIPWFALQDRGRAAEVAEAAGFGALLLCFPPAAGAAVRALRTGSRRVVAPGIGVLGGGVAAVVAVVAGSSAGDSVGGALMALPLLLLTMLAAVATSDRETRRMTASAIGAASFSIGCLALVAGQVGRVWARGLSALPDFDAVWSRVGALEGHAAAVNALPGVLVPPLVIAALCLVPTVVGQPFRGLDARSGMDGVGLVLLGLGVAVLWGWVPFRWQLLSHLAGDHGAAVLDERRGYDVPRRALVPPRILVADPAHPRWVLQRERGGVERGDVIGGLESAAAALRGGDGLVFARDLTMEDVYFTLADASAGSLAVVGCGEVPAEAWRGIERDPLRATGRCGAFPLRMRVDDDLRHPRKLIVLRERSVDDGGEVLPIRDVADLDGRVIVVRGQADALVSDLIALLQRLGNAGPVYLGWGVAMDGDDIPVGVNPGVRVRARRGGEEPAPPPIGQEAGASPVQ